MPTGYTHSIKDGITFKDFVMNCSRAMPERFEPTDYHVTQIKDLEAKLMRLRYMNPDECQAEADTKHDKDVQGELDRNREDNVLLGRYNTMLTKVKSWNPPTSEHQGLKDFMIEQLTSSIDWDCRPNDAREIPKPSERAHIEEQINITLKTIAYHRKAHEEEVERTEGRNLWIGQLRDSLK